MERATVRTAEPTGITLRDARERLGLSRADVARRTRIPRRYLDQLEDGETSGLDAYTKIYLKAYGKFLGLDTRELVSGYGRETLRAQAEPRAEHHGRRHPLTNIPGVRLTNGPRLIKVAAGVLIAAGIVAYFVGALQQLVAPPAITLFTPQDGMVTADRTIPIEGLTEREVSLRINGKGVGIDDEGRFNDAIDLQEGLNVIRIVGAKKHSREMVVERRVIVKPNERRAATLDVMDLLQE